VAYKTPAGLVVADLYFYRDIIKLFYSLALGAMTVFALLFLWHIPDYTDPDVTGPWLRRYVDKWWSRGLPRSFAYTVMGALLFGLAPAYLLEYGFYGRQGRHHQANGLAVVIVSGGVYLWLVFALACTAWRRYFLGKVQHSRAYASIVMLKASLDFKSKACFVVLFLTYLPTCLYVVGATVPLYSLKVWDRHGAFSATEPPDAAYRHVPCYYLSFPPRIRPEASRARKARWDAPGFCAYAPHAHRPHSATNQVDCYGPAGVLVHTAGVVAVVVYLIGLPLLVSYLVDVASAQLRTCDWWSNYLTADRRFTHVLEECEAWPLDETLKTTAALFYFDAQRQATRLAQTAVDVRIFLRLLLSKLSLVFRIFCVVFRGVLRLFVNVDDVKAARKKKLQMKTRGRAALMLVSQADSTELGFDEFSRLEETKEAPGAFGEGMQRFEDQDALKGPLPRRVGAKVARGVAAVFCGCWRAFKAYVLCVGRAERCERYVERKEAALEARQRRALRADAEGFKPPTDCLRRRLFELQASSKFDNGVMFLVLVSMVQLIWAADLSRLIGEVVVDDVMFYVNVVFALEFLVKIVALGPKWYFKSYANDLDFFLVLMWLLLDVLLSSGTQLSFLKSLKALRTLKSLKGLRALKSLRSLRVLRFFKFAKFGAPLLRAFKRWLLRWLSDMDNTDVLLKRLEAAGAAGAWRVSRSLSARLEALKTAWQHAKGEYVSTFDEFLRDHELVITAFEAVLDTAALGYLLRPYKAEAAHWRLVLLFETLCFSATLSWVKASRAPWIQCAAGALVVGLFAAYTALKRPYLYANERRLDALSRAVVFSLLVVGVFVEQLPAPRDGRHPETAATEFFRHALDTVGVVVACLTLASLLYLLRAHEAVHACLAKTVHALDSAVLKLVVSRIDAKCYVFEDSNLGLRVLQQWDDLIEAQHGSAFLAWPKTHPREILTWREKLFHVKWAAFRNMTLTALRTPTGQCVLHSAMLKGEPEAVKWLLYEHPALLGVCDEQRDSPVVIALKELAGTLLAHQAAPTAVTAWKRAKLAEILLCDEVQSYAVPWSLSHFRALGDIATPLFGELVQQLALALNLRPPRGFVRVSKWAKYPGDIPDFLGQCYVACRRAVDAPRAELGDIGARTFEALMAAIELPQTSVTTWSNFFCGYPISISKLDARFNRLDNSAGLLFAQTLLQNRSLSVVDLRFNDVDDAAGVDVGAALRVNDALTTLSLAHNRFGPATGAALGAALRRNGTLKTLNVAHNMLGPRLRWQNKHQRIFIESSATLLFMALAKNSALTALDVSDNALGAEAAKGLDFALRKNPQSALRTVNLAGNKLRDAGGRALAHVLKQDKCNLTSLDCSRNRMGAVVGVALAAALRKNKRLVHLDVSSNGLSTKGGRAIALALAEDNRILVGLNCESNGLGPDALRAFSQCLSKNPTLTHLDLALNALSTSTYDGGDVDGVCGVLGAALAKNSTLTFLDLRGFTLESEELMLALQGFGKNKGLCRVNLDSQPFTNANVLQLTNALEQHRVRDRCEYGDVPRGAGAPNARDRALERRRQAKVGKAQAAPKILVDTYIVNRLVSIDLSDCRLGSRTGPVVIAALLHLPRLRELDVAGNDIGVKLGERLAEHFTKAGNYTAKMPCGLLSLNVARNKLGVLGGLGLAKALNANGTLRHVDCSHNGLDAKVAALVGEALEEFQESGVVLRAAHCASLVLAGNAIGAEAAVGVFNSLRVSVVTSVDLSRCSIGPFAGATIGACLRRHTIQWKRLNLEGNDLGKDGANPIFWALRLNCSLVELYLASNGLGPDFGTQRDAFGSFGNSLAAALERNYTLRRLDLASNGLSVECGIGFAEALSENPAIVSINLEHNGFDRAAADAIAIKLESDRQLRSINLRSNFASWDGGVRIAQALEVNVTLVHLDLSNNHLGDNGPVAGRALRAASEPSQ